MNTAALQHYIPEALADLSERFTVTATYLWIAVGVTAAITAIATIVLLYHWHHYSYDTRLFGATKIIYFVGVVVLLGTAVVSALLY